MTTRSQLLTALGVILGLATLSSSTAQQRQRFARQWFTARPIDLASVPGLAQATGAIAAAVRARDHRRLAEWMADDVLIGGGETREIFLTTLGAAEWQDLARAIEVGYVGDGQQYFAPYTFGMSGLPPLRDDEMAVAVVGAAVRVRRAPERTSPVVDTVSYAIVRRADEDRGGPWCRVVATDGTTGYIDRRHISHIRGMTIQLERRAGGWKIVAIGYGGD
jgi:hypothetical protein